MVLVFALFLALVPNDPWYADPYNGQWHLPWIGAEFAWDETTGDPGIIVAVIDSGADSDHEDLQANLIEGWNFITQTTDTEDTAGGHGTLVSGQIGAIGNNGVGVAAPVWHCKILPLVAPVSQWPTAITFARMAGARVVNISSSYSDNVPVEAAARALVLENNGVVVMASGNSPVVAQWAGSPWIVVVSGTRQNDDPAPFTTGPMVDLSAPSVSIMTTKIGGNYALGSGTSAACAVVSGVAAAVMSTYPDLDGVTVVEILKCTAVDLGDPGWDPVYGWGRVDLGAAVEMARAIREGEIFLPVCDEEEE